MYKASEGSHRVSHCSPQRQPQQQASKILPWRESQSTTHSEVDPSLDPGTIHQLHSTIRSLPRPALEGPAKAFRKRFQGPGALSIAGRNCQRGHHESDVTPFVAPVPIRAVGVIRPLSIAQDQMAGLPHNAVTQVSSKRILYDNASSLLNLEPSQLQPREQQQDQGDADGLCRFRQHSFARLYRHQAQLERGRQVAGGPALRL